MTKRWKIKAENLKGYHKQAKELLEQQMRCKIMQVKQADNGAGRLL
jgi:hypothetical protein